MRKGSVARRYAVNVETFEDFLSGDFDELNTYGIIIKTEKEKQEMDRKIETNKAQLAVRGL